MCLCVRESWDNGNFKESGVSHDWVYLKLGANVMKVTSKS